MTERTIISKMTFYDIVTLVVPSALVCCAWGWSPFSGADMSWLSYVAQFGMLLMIGLLLKSISMWWSGLWFRNQTDMIQTVEENNANLLENVLCTFVCAPVRYIFSPISGWRHKQNEVELKRYYKKYDNAYNDAYSGKRIELLESHVAFLQTWSWALAVCLVGQIGKGHWAWCSSYAWGMNGWLLGLGIYACIVAMVILQKKIYQVVWVSIDKEK